MCGALKIWAKMSQQQLYVYLEEEEKATFVLFLLILHHWKQSLPSERKKSGPQIWIWSDFSKKKKSIADTRI